MFVYFLYFDMESDDMLKMKMGESTKTIKLLLRVSTHKMSYETTVDQLSTGNRM